MSYTTKGSTRAALPLYTPGYVIGTKKEGPSAYIFLNANLTFGGFVPNYRFGDQGVLVVTQDSVGGRTINWDGKLAFNGSATLSSSPLSRTIIDVIRVDGGVWIGTVRAGAGTGGGGSAPNGLPAGGTNSQLLRKNSPTDYDAGWYTLTKNDIGLNNVDNTSDLTKPISTPTQLALNDKAPLLNPIFQGQVQMPSSSGTGAGVKFTPGFNPLTPTNGEWWLTNDGYYSMVNGSIVQIGARTTVSIQDFQLAASDLTTPLVMDPIAAYNRVTRAGTFIEVRASLNLESTAGDVVIDIKKNGVSILSTLLTIPEGLRTSVGAPVAAVLIDGAVLPDDEIQVEVVNPGTDAAGLIVSCIYENTVNSAAGFQGQLQYNNAGDIAAATTLVYDDSLSKLTVTNLHITGTLTGPSLMANPMTAVGDLVVGGTLVSGTATPVRLGIGTNGHFMTVASGTPAWVAITKTTVGLANVDNTADSAKNVLSASKWTTGRNFTFTDDVTGSATGVDGSANVSISMTLPPSGVSAGIYQQVQVDAKGRVIDGTNPTTLEGYGITNALSNPMTTKGAIMYGDTPVAGSAPATPLPIGTAEQVLAVDTTTLVPYWKTIADGFDNPMTTAGDLIVGGASGAATRLALSTDGKILMTVAGAPAWADSPYLTSPMTTRGDIIVRGASAAARLALGTTGQILGSDGTDVVWTNTINNAAFTGTPTGLTKAHVGLGSVNNTADVAKDVLSATKLFTARNIAVAGAVTGTTAFNGTTDVTITTTSGFTWNTQTASYGLVLADADKGVMMDLAGANNLTVPLNSTQAFRIGTRIRVVQKGAGLTTIVATGGVTIQFKSGKGLKMDGQWSKAELEKIGTDEWLLTGEVTP